MPPFLIGGTGIITTAEELINHAINKNRGSSSVASCIRFDILQQFAINLDMNISRARLSTGNAVISSIVGHNVSFPGDRDEDPRRPDPPCIVSFQKSIMKIQNGSIQFEFSFSQKSSFA